MYRNLVRFTAVLLACVAASGCVPEETATVAVPANVSTAALFDCADAAVRELHRTDEQWNLRIDRRQVVGGGVFETGTFDEENVMGYRVRLVRRDAEPIAALSVRAAGPYFTDLGAAPALSSFRSRLDACTARIAPTR